MCWCVIVSSILGIRDEPSSCLWELASTLVDVTIQICLLLGGWGVFSSFSSSSCSSWLFIRSPNFSVFRNLSDLIY